jgi:hypothetical protein
VSSAKAILVSGLCPMFGGAFVEFSKRPRRTAHHFQAAFLGAALKVGIHTSSLAQVGTDGEQDENHLLVIPLPG